MSRLERTRYTVGHKLLSIVVAAVFMALITFQYLPVDRSNPYIALLQLIVIASAEVIVASLLVLFFFGEKPKKYITES